MEIFYLPGDNNRIPPTPRVVALGLFDGMHIGHRAVVAEAIRLGEGHCAVYTFSPQTIYTKGAICRVCTATEQNTLLAAMGVTAVFETDFTAVCNLTPAEFVKSILHDLLHATAVTCGFNYRFGKNGEGDATMLIDLCKAFNIDVSIIPAVESDGQTVSSTAIRAALASGDMATARRLLNRGYCLHLPVEQGQHLGRRLGMPTINQVLPTDLASPRYGVYSSCIEIDEKVYYGVTNIGIRPTVGTRQPLAETWIADFTGDLYGKTVKVYPLTYLREEHPFRSLDDLRTQVARDAEIARAQFTANENAPIQAVLFDFDDTLHFRDAAFVIACHKFIARYYPALSAEEHKARVADMIAFDDYGYHRPATYPEYIERYLTKWEKTAYTSVEDALQIFSIDFSSACVPIDGVLDTLKELRRRGYRLGVITNGYSFLQNHKLDFANIRPLMDLTIVSYDEGIHKPRAAIFRRAAARLGLPCEACMYVGDHPVNDIGGARAAGMTAVRIDYGFPAGHPIYDAPVPPEITKIHRFEELLSLPSLSATGILDL